MRRHANYAIGIGMATALLTISGITLAVTTSEIEEGILGTATPTPEMDVNEDSVVDAADLVVASQPAPFVPSYRGNIWTASIFLDNGGAGEIPIHYILFLEIPESGDAEVTQIKGFDPGKPILAQDLSDPTASSEADRVPGVNRSPYSISNVIPAGTTLTIQESGQAFRLSPSQAVRIPAGSGANPFGVSIARNLEIVLPAQPDSSVVEGTVTETTEGVLPNGSLEKTGTVTMTHYSPATLTPLEPISSS